jgi:hypothetical protein
MRFLIFDFTIGMLSVIMVRILSYSLISMYRYTPLILIGLVPMILVSCGKTDDVLPTQSGSTSSGIEAPKLSREEVDALFAAEAAKPFSANSGSTTDISAYIQGGERNIPELIASLPGSDATTVAKRSYLRSYMGDYSGALSERDTLCKNDTSKCAKYGITLDISSTVDQSGTIISAPNIYLDGQPLAVESSIVQPKTYDDMVHRVRVEKEGYLDAYQKLAGAESGIKQFSVASVMAKASLMIEMDNQTGGSYTAGDGSGAITYTIAPNTFASLDGKIVQSKVSLYLFALGRDDNALSSFSLDVFSASGSNVGTSMVTDGMPFVTAYQDGKELTIAKSIV